MDRRVSDLQVGTRNVVSRTHALPLTVVIVANATRPGDGKLSSLVGDFADTFSSMVVSGSKFNVQNIAGCDGWVMILPDDSIMNQKRLTAVFCEFTKFATLTSVLLPYKMNNSCDLGASISKGQFYRCTEVRSFRGMIFHSSVIHRILKLHRVEAKAGGEAPGAPAIFEIEDPLSIMRPRKSSMNSSRCEEAREAVHCDIGESEEEEECRQSSDDQVMFGIPLGYPDQVCILTFYTVYPNVVQFDTKYATRHSDMVKMNECKVFPSNMSQYIRNVAYENVYTIVVVVIISFMVLFLISSKYSAKS